MKSYVLPPKKFGEKAKLADKYGADIIALVDSAGGFLPKDVKEYMAVLQRETTTKLGYHGHNNLSLAIANTLEAINCGASVVDSSLKGMGRSAGNAQTEVLVTILTKMGYKLGIDMYRTMDLAENLIEPLMATHRGIDSIAITSGYAEFHSSFLGTIYGAAKKYAIDPRDLIVRVCEKDKVRVPEELAMSVAKELFEERAAKSEIGKIFIDIGAIEKKEPKGLAEKARVLAKSMYSMSKKNGKQIVFAINISRKGENIVFPFVHESSSYLMANCDMVDKKQILEVVKKIDGIVDFILVDDDKKRVELQDLTELISKSAKKSVVLPYKEANTWVRAIEEFITQKAKGAAGLKIIIAGINDICNKLALSLMERGARVYLYDSDKKKADEHVRAINALGLKASFRAESVKNLEHACKDADILIGLDFNSPIVTADAMRRVPHNAIVVDATVGAIHHDAIRLAKKRKIPIWRIDMRAATAGEVTTTLRTDMMVKGAGRGNLGGMPVVAGGYVGNRGDIVVDSISNPTKVIGVADGFGGVIYDKKEYRRLLKKAKMELIKRKIG
jgi:hypothetical protein